MTLFAMDSRLTYCWLLIDTVSKDICSWFSGGLLCLHFHELCVIEDSGGGWHRGRCAKCKKQYLFSFLHKYSMHAIASNENVVNSLCVKYKSNWGVLLNGMCFSLIYEGLRGGQYLDHSCLMIGNGFFSLMSIQVGFFMKQIEILFLSDMRSICFCSLSYTLQSNLPLLPIVLEVVS